MSKPLHIPLAAVGWSPAHGWARLDDICDGVFDCPHTTPTLVEDGPYVARSQDVRGRAFDWRNAGKVSSATYEARIARAEPKFGDLLYSREGTYFGMAAEVPRGMKVCLGQRMVLIRPRKTHLDHRFLLYWLNSPVMERHLGGFRDGSVAERLNMATIRALSVPIARLSEQREIANTLGTLDDKIELNRKTAATLEEMARMLYRSWFVDFDPVHARAEGRAPAYMDATTADLFPDSFGEDGLPAGWKVGSLGGVSRNSRSTVDPSAISSETPYVGLEHIPRRSIYIGDWGVADDVGSAKSTMKKGQFLFGKLRPYFHKVGLVPIDGICSTDILVVEAKLPIWSEFVLSVISSVELVDHVNAASTGTRMPRAKWQDLAAYQIAVASDAVVRKFSEIVGPTHDRILSLVQENRTLAALRDTLLPRLMSGELRVNAARDMVEKVD